MTAVRLLLAAALLCLAGAVQAASDAAPELAAIERRLAEVQADPTLAEGDRAAIVAQLQAAQRHLQSAAELEVQRQSLSQTAAQAPRRIAMLRRRPITAPVVPPGADLVQLGAVLSETQAALEAALAEHDAHERQVQSLTQAPTELQAELARLRSALAEVEDRLGQVEDSPAGADALAEATGLALSAQAVDLRAQIALAEERLRTVQARRELAQVQRDLAERRVGVLKDQVAAVSARLSELRQDQARQELADAEALVRATANAHPLIRRAATEQADLTRELARVLRADAKTGLAIEQVHARQLEIDNLRRTTEAQLQLASLSAPLAQALRDRRLRLPRPRDLQREIAARSRDISQARLRQLELSEQRRGLGLPYQQAAEQVAALAPPLAADQQDALRQRLGNLLRAQADLLNRLDDAYARRIAMLGELNLRQRQLSQAAQEYADLLDRRLLWIADLPPLGTGGVATWRTGFAVLLQPPGRVPAADLQQAPRQQPLLLLGLLLAVVLLALRGRLRRWQRRDTPRLADVNRDRGWLTLLAIVYAALRAAPWSLALYCAGQWLSAVAAQGAVMALGIALVQMTPAVFVLGFLQDLARADGVLEAHYQWQPQARRTLRRHLAMLRLVAVPAGLLVIYTQALAQPALRGTVGRLAFLVLSLALARFVWQLLHPQRGVLAGCLAGRADSRLWRYRHVWHTSLALLPLVPAVLAVVGFYYAGLQLQRRLVYSAAGLLALLLVYYLILRAVALAQSRISLEQALARQSGEAGPPARTAGELDIEGIDDQARSLLGFFFTLALAGMLLWVWSDLLPALRALEDVVLWHYGSAGGEVGTVTLLTVLLALVGVAVTVLAARNLPGVLEIAVFRRTQMDAGARYAALTILRYLIVSIGVVVVVNLLGLQWSKAQWLVAALGVGVGFGLQEIIANFISGLIILGERPFRIGDTVTVGDISGSVARIRIRATTITDFERKELIVPNKTFITGQFVNWTLSDQISRVTVKVGVAYGSDTQRVCEILADVAEANQRVARDPAPQVWFMAFGESSLDFELRVYVRQLEDRLPATHELHMAIDQALRAAGVEIPFPQRDLHLRSVDARAGQALAGGAPPA
ncbi:MAG: mechanosensitive channel MscK [Immundisolibacter sp.]